MLKFFRRIRQKLLAQHKTGQYLKYAAGEIVLVVIGILVALQINGWNEKLKESMTANPCPVRGNISVEKFITLFNPCRRYGIFG